ncbi:hypothetical protein [Acinetobacter baumannii]|uniref:hypothetical protein n=1 Tax=Acinetobacter baumannii TaxID=470 RepID=UPI00280E9F15|nr:hypothetical protein [Acinetobacter baumannii]MDQ8938177.1 hypothetical protein [Acinetobacter baumannii]
MSEFKVGDKITTLLCDDILTVIGIGHGHFLKAKGFNSHGMIDGECNVLSFQVKHATPEEIAAGHRIDMPTLPEPVGSLQELHPEFAKVLHENFLELLGDESNTVQVAKDAIEHGNDLAMVSIEGVEHVSIAQVIKPFPCEELGDDFPIENRISPLCKSKDV